ncbi:MULTISPECIES: sensor histidine kinase [unclassified Sphingomonas]|uniref:sensor histidine kinase n=1 Tax=unclassified Sphingomonas TaxID=196159 RepID=UPI0022697EBC|nr:MULTISPECIES: sensor histidine kinase [unclassified Sphingomonas]
MDEAVITITATDVRWPARLIDRHGMTMWRSGPRADGSSLSAIGQTIRIPARDAGGDQVVLELIDLNAPDPLDAVQMRETEHRSRNLVSVALAVARQSLRGLEQDPRVNAMFDRLQSLNAVVSSGCEIEGDFCSLLAIARRVTARFEDPTHPQIALSGLDVPIAARWAHLITLVLHELAVNAIRHGALSVAQGRVDLRWSVTSAAGDEDVQLILTWRERQGPPVVPHVRQGMGTRLLDALVGSSSRCSSDLRMRESGVVYTLSIKLAAGEVGQS